MAKKNDSTRTVTDTYRLPGGMVYSLNDLLSDLAKHWGVTVDDARARCLKTGIRREVALARNAGVKTFGKVNTKAPAPNRKVGK